jgi:hypothetical protein
MNFGEVKVILRTGSDLSHSARLVTQAMSSARSITTCSNDTFFNDIKSFQDYDAFSGTE